MGRLRVAACLLAVFTSGCSLLDLRPLEVLAWAPASSTIASEPAEVWLRFSRAPARTSAEAAFSLSGTDGTVQGAYAWDGATLRFEPLLPLVRGMQYTLAVSRDAEDTLGNSLAADFVHRFRIGADTTNTGFHRCVSSLPIGIYNPVYAFPFPLHNHSTDIG